MDHQATINAAWQAKYLSLRDSTKQIVEDLGALMKEVSTAQDGVMILEELKNQLEENLDVAHSAAANAVRAQPKPVRKIDTAVDPLS